MNMSYKICFVCTGNACRSPFAECVMRKLLADAGMNDIEVFSLGTLAHIIRLQPYIVMWRNTSKTVVNDW